MCRMPARERCSPNHVDMTEIAQVTTTELNRVGQRLHLPSGVLPSRMCSLRISSYRRYIFTECCLSVFSPLPAAPPNLPFSSSPTHAAVLPSSLKQNKRSNTNIQLMFKHHFVSCRSDQAAFRLFCHGDGRAGGVQKCGLQLLP